MQGLSSKYSIVKHAGKKKFVEKINNLGGTLGEK
jgi:hypothetical protein